MAIPNEPDKLMAVLDAPPIRDVIGKYGFVGKVIRIVPELP
jgi:hypothetical protein